MTSAARFIAAFAALIALGAAAPRAHPRLVSVRRPAFVDATRFDRFAPNAIRRARLAFLMPKRLSAAAQSVALRLAGEPGATSYKVLNLDAIIADSGTGIYPTALNNDGRIVGMASGEFPDNVSPGFLINNSGSHAVLDSLSFGYNFYPLYFPTAISNKGSTVAGFTDLEAQYGPDDEFTYYDSDVWNLYGATGSSLRYYQNPTPVSDPTQIADIANGNIPVGGRDYWSADGVRTPFAVSNCAISNFYASAIDDAGAIVGYSDTKRATALTLGSCPTFIPNVANGYVADAIASNGDMLLKNGVGFELWAKGKVYSIPLPSGFSATSYAVDAIALNASDVVVGNVVAQNGYPVAAFEYASNVSVNLQRLFPKGSGWVAMGVTGINDRGEIIGQGYVHGVFAAFALRH